MADYQEEDLFDDLYDDEPASKPTPAAAAPLKAESEVKTEPQNASTYDAPQDAAPSWQEPAATGGDTNMDGPAFNNGGNQSYGNDQNNDNDYGPINVKEDG
ncbi:uncharacterized protein M421DRAFT_319887 [Didymella exigua CBS 183.55]|uniref:Uncharacterized protein n=1 Tax=Didymella exigua CBS 183.55 TaxID=1150837 RepID=A0A6A5S2I4_9PLEO|nr:uncharacterized protein M421DRAFT_319887 [Didymella exigua CBS 183.55]KAF1931747.1 hypothetical protein M421DRAFT_319887 [Didymella exigua CBS 183.55]